MSNVISKEQFERAIEALNDVVRSMTNESAFEGLRITAHAFGALLDVYAKPNAENPQGMCDDPAAFRRVFAEMVAQGVAQ